MKTKNNEFTTLTPFFSKLDHIAPPRAGQALILNYHLRLRIYKLSSNTPTPYLRDADYCWRAKDQ